MTIENPYATPDNAEVLSRNAWWTAEGALLSDEEKKRIIDDMEARAAEQSRDVVVIPRSQMESIHAALKEIGSLGRHTLDEWMSMDPKLAELKHRVRSIAEFPALFAGQCLRMNEKEEKR